MDKILTFILEKGVYKILLYLKKRKYVIPVDTTKDHIEVQNGLINSVSFAADVVCAFLIVYGWNQTIVTYISLVTISLYTFVDQYKIYSIQKIYLYDSQYICEIRQREHKYLKRSTPNSICRTIAMSILAGLLTLIILEMSGIYGLQKVAGYRWIIIIVLVILMFIKTKYIFLDTFNVKEFTCRKQI